MGEGRGAGCLFLLGWWLMGCLTPAHVVEGDKLLERGAFDHARAHYREALRGEPGSDAIRRKYAGATLALVQKRTEGKKPNLGLHRLTLGLLRDPLLSPGHLPKSKQQAFERVRNQSARALWATVDEVSQDGRYAQAYQRARWVVRLGGETAERSVNQVVEAAVRYHLSRAVHAKSALVELFHRRLVQHYFVGKGSPPSVQLAENQKRIQRLVDLVSRRYSASVRLEYGDARCRRIEKALRDALPKSMTRVVVFLDRCEWDVQTTHSRQAFPYQDFAWREEQKKESFYELVGGCAQGKCLRFDPLGVCVAHARPPAGCDERPKRVLREKMVSVAKSEVVQRRHDAVVNHHHLLGRLTGRVMVQGGAEVVARPFDLGANKKTSGFWSPQAEKLSGRPLLVRALVASLADVVGTELRAVLRRRVDTAERSDREEDALALASFPGGMGQAKPFFVSRYGLDYEPALTPLEAYPAPPEPKVKRLRRQMRTPWLVDRNQHVRNRSRARGQKLLLSSGIDVSLSVAQSNLGSGSGLRTGFEAFLRAKDTLRIRVLGESTFFGGDIEGGEADIVWVVKKAPRYFLTVGLGVLRKSFEETAWVGAMVPLALQAEVFPWLMFNANLDLNAFGVKDLFSSPDGRNRYWSRASAGLLVHPSQRVFVQGTLSHYLGRKSDGHPRFGAAIGFRL